MTMSCFFAILLLCVTVLSSSIKNDHPLGHHHHPAPAPSPPSPPAPCHCKHVGGEGTFGDCNYGNHTRPVPYLGWGMDTEANFIPSVFCFLKFCKLCARRSRLCDFSEPDKGASISFLIFVRAFWQPNMYGGGQECMQCMFENNAITVIIDGISMPVDTFGTCSLDLIQWHVFVAPNYVPCCGILTKRCTFSFSRYCATDCQDFLDMSCKAHKQQGISQCMMCVMERQFTLASITSGSQGVDNGLTGALSMPGNMVPLVVGPGWVNGKCIGDQLCNTWNNTSGNRTVSNCAGKWTMPPIVKEYCTSD